MSSQLMTYWMHLQNSWFFKLLIRNFALLISQENIFIQCILLTSEALQLSICIPYHKIFKVHLGNIKLNFIRLTAILCRSKTTVISGVILRKEYKGLQLWRFLLLLLFNLAHLYYKQIISSLTCINSNQAPHMHPQHIV